ncbi:hypothetical protein SRABI27_03495 [Pedobacter sp. Bi27]|nr:hypothetical protein SRABI36_00954 [Pedobacter sp. Bi36]CAH0214006.1 hypothetical protein SRABI126_02046 [Pedobacter sp. Bi126]CAH0271065.1 hypothetical protein SRABI27_03495 [Pedobacter sp. Bi27]
MQLMDRLANMHCEQAKLDWIIERLYNSLKQNAQLPMRTSDLTSKMFAYRYLKDIDYLSLLTNVDAHRWCGMDLRKRFLENIQPLLNTLLTFSSSVYPLTYLMITTQPEAAFVPLPVSIV